MAATASKKSKPLFSGANLPDIKEYDLHCFTTAYTPDTPSPMDGCVTWMIIYKDEIVARRWRVYHMGSCEARGYTAEGFKPDRGNQEIGYNTYKLFSDVAEAYQAFFRIMQTYVGLNRNPDKAAAMEFEMTDEVKAALFAHPQFMGEVEVSGDEDNIWWAIVPVENKVETYKVVFDDGKYATWLAQQD